ncbi:MAG TPA: hypothetical protein VFY23_09195, partial [Candidatus Limnocylindrales bacterium]|nr:hypothetical protein [Candidatus Limnocylindrales bacterium]
MPHIPDSAHPTHDLELIAAFAADDLESRELERARAIVASCADCARLADDLRAIAAAIAVIPAPARSRDFRLSRGDAARLRPSGPRGFLAGLSGPRFAFATPLGTAFAAIGIVGVVAASGGLPAGGGATGAAPGALSIEEASATVEEAPYQL